MFERNVPIAVSSAGLQFVRPSGRRFRSQGPAAPGQLLLCAGRRGAVGAVASVVAPPDCRYRRRIASIRGSLRRRTPKPYLRAVGTAVRGAIAACMALPGADRANRGWAYLDRLSEIGGESPGTAHQRQSCSLPPRSSNQCPARVRGCGLQGGLYACEDINGGLNPGLGFENGPFSWPP